MIADLKPHRQIHKQPIHIRRPLILSTLFTAHCPLPTLFTSPAEFANLVEQAITFDHHRTDVLPEQRLQKVMKELKNPSMG